MKRLFLFAAAIFFFGWNSAFAQNAVERFNASLENEVRGKISEALNDMSQIGSNDSGYLVVLRQGWLHYLAKNYVQSENNYRRALKLSGNVSIEALLGLTLPLAAQEKWAEVETTYQTILKIDPVNYTANLWLGQIYQNRADYTTAQKYLSKAWQYYPGEYEINLSAGWNHYFLGEKEPARTCFMNALMLSPQDSSATRGLGLLK